ncbi:MAG: WbqC family protein [Lewinellaceae bacterium]|nr:WbqC family protein [Lewinellaceae bacterium]
MSAFPHLSLCYLPPVSWCAVAWNSDVVVIEAREHYQKGSLRNRCYIAGPNGVQRLSIPLVKGKHQQMPIREVRIAYDEPWQRLHWRSIRTAYGNAPYFEHYADDLSPFYEKRFDFLLDYNIELLSVVLQKKLGWPGEIRLSERFRPPDVFESDTSRRYPQVFEEKHGFLPDLSILDLLLCCGKEGGGALGISI